MRNRLGVVLVIVFLIVQLFIYPALPDEIVTKWNFNGEPTQTLSKMSHFVITVIVMAFILLLFEVKSRAMSENNARIFLWVANGVIFFAFCVNILLSLYAMGYEFPLLKVLLSLLGLLLIGLGFITSKVQLDRNYFNKWNNKWNNEEIFKRALMINRTCMMICGTLIIIATILVPEPFVHYVIFTAIVAMAIVNVIASLVLKFQDTRYTSKK